MPPGTARVRSRSSTWGSGPVSSTVVCGGRVTALSLGSWTVDVAEGTWMLVSLSVRLVLLDRARNIPASLPAGSCSAGAAPRMNTFLIEMPCRSVPAPSVGWCHCWVGAW